MKTSPHKYLSMEVSQLFLQVQGQNTQEYWVLLPLPKVLCYLGKLNSPHWQVIKKDPLDFMKSHAALQRWSQHL